MALFKNIRQDDGVTTNYHRILYMTQVVNQQNSIAVVSYVDSESRESDNMDSPVYKKAITYETKYDEGMTIETAYEYLKTLPAFDGAEDV